MNKEFHALARKWSINLIGASHYHTEKCAVQDIAVYLEQNGIQAAFLPDPILEEYSSGNWIKQIFADQTYTGGTPAVGLGVIYVDGAALGTSSNSAFNVSETEDTVGFGIDLNGTDNASYCAFDEIIITKDVKPASWFQQKFSARYALGEGRNYWSSVRLANLNYARQALRGGRSTIPLEFEEVLS